MEQGFCGVEVGDVLEGDVRGEVDYLALEGLDQSGVDRVWGQGLQVGFAGRGKLRLWGLFFVHWITTALWTVFVGWVGLFCCFWYGPWRTCRLAGHFHTGCNCLLRKTLFGNGFSLRRRRIPHLRILLWRLPTTHIPLHHLKVIILRFGRLIISLHILNVLFPLPYP